MGILERLKNAGQRKAPADLISEIDADIAATEGSLPGLDAQRAEALLLGALDDVTKIESQISDTRLRLDRLRERRTLLEAAAAEVAAEQEAHRLADLRVHGEQVAGLGPKLLSHYETQAAALARTLAAWIAIDVEICRANSQLLSAGQKPITRPLLAVPPESNDLMRELRLPAVRRGHADIWDDQLRFIAQRDAAQLVAELLAKPSRKA